MRGFHAAPDTGSVYQKTIVVFTASVILGIAAVLWTAGSDSVPTGLDYLGREALPEDLPEIPGPPRSAERTLYDTLGGGNRSPEKSPARNTRSTRAATQTGESGTGLPLLPVRRSNGSQQSTGSQNQNESAPPRLERVPEPVPTIRRSKSQEPGPGHSVKDTAAAKKTVPKPPEQKRLEEKKKQPRIVNRKSEPEQKRNKQKKTTPAKTSRSKSNLQKRNAERSSKSKKAARSEPGASRTVGKHDPTIRPTPRGEFRYYAPHFYRGVYLNNGVVRSKKRYEKFFEQCRKYKINTLVADVQPRFPSNDFIRAARESGFYLVARVVVFEGGLKQPTLPKKHLNRVLDAAEQAARSGFMEIQLDYIRFADRARIGNLSLKQRYHLIASILKMATDRLRPHGVRIGADIFGRIPFNQNDRIGQRMEVFAEHLDTLYPMLYPSHFYGDPSYIKDPYKTILQGKKKAIARVGDQSRIIAYIQGFKMKVGPSGLSYHNYIRKQIEASADSGGAGFVVWNARSSYGPFFRALADFDRKQAR